SQPAEDGPRAFALRVIDEEPVEGVDLDARRVFAHVLDRLANHLDPLVDGEQGVLARVVQDRDDDLLEAHEPTLEDARVPTGDWVERTRIDGGGHPMLSARASSATAVS